MKTQSIEQPFSLRMIEDSAISNLKMAHELKDPLLAYFLSMIILHIREKY